MKWSRIGPQCTVAKCSGLENTVHHSYMWQSGEHSTLQLNETNQLETTETVCCKCIVHGGGLEKNVSNVVTWRTQCTVAKWDCLENTVLHCS